MTQKLWAPLNPARRDASFGTLGSPIRALLGGGDQGGPGVDLGWTWGGPGGDLGGTWEKNSYFRVDALNFK